MTRCENFRITGDKMGRRFEIVIYWIILAYASLYAVCFLRLFVRTVVKGLLS